jgi:hypothetical protein
MKTDVVMSERSQVSDFFCSNTAVSFEGTRSISYPIVRAIDGNNSVTLEVNEI